MCVCTDRLTQQVPYHYIYSLDTHHYTPMSLKKVGKHVFHISSSTFLNCVPYLRHSGVAALKQRHLQAIRCKC